MKKTYIQPETFVFAAQASHMMAASVFDPNKDEQDITLTDDIFDGEFSTKESTGIDW